MTNLPRQALALELHRVAAELGADEKGTMEIVVSYRNEEGAIETIACGKARHVQALALHAFHELAECEPETELSEISEALVGPGDTHL